MARTNSDLVQEILLRDYDLNYLPNLTPFIRSANLIVTRVNTCATARGFTLSDDELQDIETWLAAHLYTRSDPAYSTRSTGKALGVFQGKTAMGLDASYYGQTAKLLDPSGCLASISSGMVIGFGWLGKAPSEQTDYVDRD